MGTLAFKFLLLGSVISLTCNRKKGLYPVVVLGVALCAMRKNGTSTPSLCGPHSCSVIRPCEAIGVVFPPCHSMPDGS